MLVSQRESASLSTTYGLSRSTQIPVRITERIWSIRSPLRQPSSRGLLFFLYNEAGAVEDCPAASDEGQGRLTNRTP